MSKKILEKMRDVMDGDIIQSCDLPRQARDKFTGRFSLPLGRQVTTSQTLTSDIELSKNSCFLPEQLKYC